MTIDALAREEAILGRLRDEYEGQGYAFYAHPPPEILPAFLRPFAVDAVALGPDHNVVIEIKAGRAGPAKETASRLAALLGAHKEWELRLIQAGPSIVPEELQPLPKLKVEGAVDQLARLHRERQFPAAFLLGWATLEGVVRTLDDGGRNSGPRQAGAIAEWLTREGFVDQNEGLRLRRMAQARDVLVHGDFTRDVDPADIGFLRSLIERLAKELA